MQPQPETTEMPTPMTVRSPTTCHPACPLVLFGEVGWAGWLLWPVECFLFSYLLPTDLDIAASCRGRC